MEVKVVTSEPIFGEHQELKLRGKRVLLQHFTLLSFFFFSFFEYIFFVEGAEVSELKLRMFSAV